MPPVTQALLIVNVGVFLLEMAGMVAFGEFALWPPRGLESRFEVWQIVTYSFLHGSVAHIFFKK